MVGCYVKKLNLFKNQIKLREKFDDFITYLIIGIIVGGRLGYVIFYNFDYYINNILIFLKFGKVGCLFMVGY